MIQLSFAVRGHAPAALSAPPPPLRLAAHPLGARVTGVWDAPSGAPVVQDLAAARRELAAWLGELPLDTRVVDLFLGHEELASAATRRLQAPPAPSTALAARHTLLAGRPWLRVFGLYQLGRPDLLVPLDPDVDLGAAYVLASRLGLASLDRDTPFPEDRPIPFGYWLLSLGSASLADGATWDLLRTHLHTHHLVDAFDERMVAPAPLLLIEAEDLVAPLETPWVIGASRAVRTWAAQTALRARCGLPVATDAPNATDAALVCDRLAVDGADAFFAYREAPQGDVDSGWRFACLDPDHVHDTSTTRIAPVHHLVARVPALAAYLALPEGWVVTREDGAFWLAEPGDERAFADEDLPPGAPWAPPGAGPTTGP